MNGVVVTAAVCAAISTLSAVAPWRPPPRQTLLVDPVRPHVKVLRHRSTRSFPSSTSPTSVRRTAISPWRSRRHRERVLDRAVPDFFDLFIVSVHAGLAPAEAIRRVRPVVHPLIADALNSVDLRITRGERLADALSVLIDRLGTRLATFVSAIASSERTGLPLGPALERIADDARRHRRHLVDTEARELPVRLTVPLVACTLPAFALVAIVPLVLGAISSLTTS